MTGGTLIVTRANNLHQHYKQRLEEFGFRNIFITDVERDGLRMLIDEMKPSLLIVEACFYETSTPYMLGVLHEDFPNLKIAVVNMLYYPENKAVRFIANGVQSYVSKIEGHDEFLKGMKCVKDGKAYISPNVKNIFNTLDIMPEPANRITRRQNEVLDLCCRGYDDLEIANLLHISKRTAETHRANIKKSLGVNTTIELYWAAVYAGLFKYDDNSFFIKHEEIK